METKALEREILLLNDPVRDYSSDDIIGLESFGVQSLKLGDQMNEEQGLKNELQKGNSDCTCAFFLSHKAW